jgi:hypothetical protein
MAEVPSAHWQGQSGEDYSYEIYPIADLPFLKKPGNYIFAKWAHAQWTPVYVGQTSDLSSIGNAHPLETCIARNGATHVHVRVNASGKQARLDEKADLLECWNTPCNHHGRAG